MTGPLRCTDTGIRDEAQLKLCEETDCVHCLLIIVPRYAVGAAAVKSAVRGEKAECSPSLVYVRRGGTLKPTDVVAPESETAAGQRQTTPQALLHGDVIAEAVSAPVHRKFLATGCSRSRKQTGLVRSAHLLQHFIHGFIVKICVEVVHLHRI